MHDPISISFKHYRAKIRCMYVCMYVSCLASNRYQHDIEAKCVTKSKMAAKA